jgi:molybdopterin synthase catalytic subunit/molybdopterin converting factor small subunit
MNLQAIRVRVLTFGPLKASFADDGEWWELDGRGSVGALLEKIKESGRIDVAALKCAAVAVNHEYASAATVLQDGDEVAILPPVSGGSVELVREPIDAGKVQAEMKAGADGAMCVFDGVVRDNTRGRRTLHLDYEAYEEMALRQMHALRAEAMSKFSVRDVAIVQRLGRMAVGETTVPIWKREQFVDGAVWADGEPFPEALTGTSG